MQDFVLEHFLDVCTVRPALNFMALHSVVIAVISVA